MKISRRDGRSFIPVLFRVLTRLFGPIPFVAVCSGPPLPPARSETGISERGSLRIATVPSMHPERIAGFSRHRRLPPASDGGGGSGPTFPSRLQPASAGLLE